MKHIYNLVLSLAILGLSFNSATAQYSCNSVTVAGVNFPTEVCAGSDVAVDLTGVTFAGIFDGGDNGGDATCAADGPEFTNVLLIASVNITVEDPAVNPATGFIAFADAFNDGNGDITLTIPAASIPNETCDPITYEVFLSGGWDLYCLDPIAMSFGTFLGTIYSDVFGGADACAGQAVSFTVFPDASSYSVQVTAPDCSGTAPMAQLFGPNGDLCATATGAAGQDMTTGCSGAGQQGSLVWDFSAPFAAWPVACNTPPANISGNLTSPACICTPVELLYVEAEEQGATNVLKWATASEFDNSHFELERSADGQKFEPIGKIDGAGTTVEEQRYQLVDANPLSVGYYRLKQVDFSGAYDYSDVVVVNRKGSGKGIVDVYPVPTSNDLNVQYEVSESRDVVFTVTDVLGRLIDRQVVEAAEGLNYYTVDMTKQTTGLYFLTYSDGLTEQTRRVLKN